MCSCNLTQYLAKIQLDLSKKIIMEDCFEDVKKVAGVDISFTRNNCAIAAAVVIDYNNLNVLEEKFLKIELIFPYISGFLGFREANGVFSVLKMVENDFDVLMVNGHGILHPRGFGLASHVGLLMDMPTVGVAKGLIGRKYKNFDNSLKPIKFNGISVGACDRQKCISIGHKISLSSSLEIVKETSIFKMPEPIRKAHILATKKMKKNNSNK
jgi:deoxyinosine 3'endonuclease (endonuclease V)